MMRPSEIGRQLETAISAQFASARALGAEEIESELRLETAADLFAAIESNDLLTRLSVLEAIAIDPEAALALGSHQNRDLIAVLRSELEQVFSPEMRMYLLAALTAMPSDSRLTTVLEQIWFLSNDTNERLCAVARLVQENNPAIREHLERSLLDNDSDRAQAVANVWKVSSQDSSTVSLRLLLAAEHFSGIVPDLEQHLELWLTELRGAFANHAREWLEVQPEPAITVLGAVWEKLNRDTRAWLLELATKTESPKLVSLTDLAMRDEHLQLEAIRAASTPAITAQYSQQLERLADQTQNPEVQAAAIRAGATGNNRTRALQASARTVWIAAIQKLGSNDQTTLLELLQDGDWRIRSAAAEQLSTLGEAGQRAVQPFLDHERLEVRMAAARVLQD